MIERVQNICQRLAARRARREVIPRHSPLINSFIYGIDDVGRNNVSRSNILVRASFFDMVLTLQQLAS